MNKKIISNVYVEWSDNAVDNGVIVRRIILCGEGTGIEDIRVVKAATRAFWVLPNFTACNIIHVNSSKWHAAKHQSIIVYALFICSVFRYMCRSIWAKELTFSKFQFPLFDKAGLNDRLSRVPRTTNMFKFYWREQKNHFQNQINLETLVFYSPRMREIIKSAITIAVWMCFFFLHRNHGCSRHRHHRRHRRHYDRAFFFTISQMLCMYFRLYIIIIHPLAGIIINECVYACLRQVCI